MAPTKTVVSVTDWTAVAQNALGESGTVDLSGAYDTILDIQAFLDSTTVHVGTKFVVMGSSHASSNEDWYELTSYVGLSTTAGSRVLTDNPLAAGSTVISMNPTAGFTALGKWIAIEDGVALADSELIFQRAVSANVSITALDGTTNAHAQNTPLYTTAEAKCIYISPPVNRVRLVVENTYDSDGSTLNYKVRASEVTGI